MSTAATQFGCENSVESKAYFLLTVDGDLRVGTLEQQEAGIRAIRQVHSDMGILGRTTWMINEVDFDWTGQHGRSLLEIVDSGECLGVHDHQDTHYAETYSEAVALMGRSRRRLAAFLEATGRSVALPAHRNGCAIQSEPLYQAAIDLGYTIVSDVWPGVRWFARMVRDGPPPNCWRQMGDSDPDAILMDNRLIPLNGAAWRHAAGNWLDFKCREGPLLQVPITSMPLVDRGRMEGAFADSGSTAFLVLDTHPYDMQDPATGEISPDRVSDYRRSLEWVRDRFQATFIRLDQVPELLPGPSG
jgi:hypothetical protein